jgi:hypothetical protein
MLAGSSGHLPGMLATLCCYENQFGPYHPVTLRLMTEVGVEYGRQGEIKKATCLLQRAVRDLTRFLGADHPATVEAGKQLAWFSLDRQSKAD